MNANRTLADDDVVRIGVAAQLLGVHPNTVRRYESLGLLTSTRTLGGEKRFRVGDLRAALARKKAAS